jgi:hypothetical protein
VDFGEFRVQIVFLVFDINDVHGGKLAGCGKKAAFLMHNAFGSRFSDGFCCYIALFLCPANRFGDCRDTTA